MVRRSWGVLVLGVLAWIFALNTGRQIAYTVAYLITAVVVFSFVWAWSGLNWIHIARYTRSRRSQVGKYAEEQFEVKNLSRWPKLWLELHDHSDLPGHQASRVVNALGPHRRQRWLVRTLCYRRGRYRLGPMSLASGDPLGLFRVERVLTATSSLVVYPPTLDLPGFAPPLGELPGGEAMRYRTHHVTTNVSSVRDYQPGDSFNRIHWRSTARTGRLIVKEFELDPTADVWIFLDMQAAVHRAAPWADVPPRMGPPILFREPPKITLPPTTEEYAVTVAASVARHFLQGNRAVGFASYARQLELIQADRGERHLNRILETLAVLQADGAIPLSQLLALEGQFLNRNTVLIVITPSTELDWVMALRELGQRGVRSAAVVIAANTFAQAPSWIEPVTTLQAYNIPTYLVRRGEPIAAALASPIRAVDGRVVELEASEVQDILLPVDGHVGV